MIKHLTVLVPLLCATLARAQPVADPSLVESLKAGDISGLKARLAAGADLNAKDQYGWTAAMWAAGHTDSTVLKTLLDAGADPAPKDASGYSAIVEAAKGGKAANIALLAARRLDCSAKDATGVPALPYAPAIPPPTVSALLASRRGPRVTRTAAPPIRRPAQCSAAVNRFSRPGEANVMDKFGYTACGPL